MAPGKPPGRARPRRKPAGAAKPRLLSGGNPQIPMGMGKAPVQSWIRALPGWKRAAAGRLDRLIARTVPGVARAVKWNSPFYGKAGRGWFLSVHGFTSYLKVGFFRGTSLSPVPPEGSKHPEVRYFHIREGERLEGTPLASWIRQAAALPGWEG